MESGSALEAPTNEKVALSIVSISPIEEVSNKKIDRNSLSHWSVVASARKPKASCSVALAVAVVPAPSRIVPHASPTLSPRLTAPSTVVVSGSGSGKAVNVGKPNDHLG